MNDEINTLVTVAMPVYNVEKYVEEAVLSVLAQSYNHIEFLIIDNCGQDKSMEIVNKVKAQHPRGNIIKIISHGKNRGLGASRNTSIKEAAGDYLCFVDSDDTIPPTAVEIMVTKMKRYKVDVLLASIQRFKKGQLISFHKYPEMTARGKYAVCDWMTNNRGIFPVQLWAKLYNIQFLREHHVYCEDSHCNEDTIFSFQIMLYANSIASINDFVYNHRVRKTSIVHSKKDSHFYHQYIEILHHRIDLMRKYGDITSPYQCTYLVEPFLDFFIEYILINNLFSRKEKERFVMEMRALCNLGFDESMLLRKHFRKMFSLLKHGSYNDLLFYLWKKKATEFLRAVLKRFRMLL